MDTLLVTGVTGQVGEVVALALAQQFHVVGLARFGDGATRERLEAGGVECVPVDLVGGNFSGVPTGADGLVNFAVVKTQKWDLDLRANAEGIGLLVDAARPGRVLHCSSTGVYDPAGSKVLDESAPLGDNHRAIMPTYSIAKIAAEEVVRTLCRIHRIPTTIARLNVPYGIGPDGEPRGWPAFHLAMMDAGMAIPVFPERPNLFNPISLDQIADTVVPLLDAASGDVTTLNWAGSEQVALEQWCERLGERCSLPVAFEETTDTIGGVTVDTSALEAVIGRRLDGWEDSFDALADAWLATR
jgi:nucleoside-diphosphate-sugar epimerase